MGGSDEFNKYRVRADAYDPVTKTFPFESVATAFPPSLLVPDICATHNTEPVAEYLAINPSVPPETDRDVFGTLLEL